MSVCVQWAEEGRRSPGGKGAGNAGRPNISALLQREQSGDLGREGAEARVKASEVNPLRWTGEGVCGTRGTGTEAHPSM